MNAHRTLIISVFIVASCGLAYELIIAALASYLLGDSILQFSSVIGLYLFSMGIGAHLTQYIKDKDVLHRFIEIELLVGIIGGISALALFVALRFIRRPVPHPALRFCTDCRHGCRHGNPFGHARVTKRGGI